MKKAQIDIVWLWRIAITFIIVGFIYFVTVDYLSAEIKTGGIEEQILLNNLISSEDCLAYKDARTFPGIIDLEKFNEARLRKCYDKNNFGFRISIAELSNINSITKSVDILSDEKKNIIDVCSSVQSYKCADISQYVLVKDNDKTYPAVIKLKVIKNAKTI